MRALLAVLLLLVAAPAASATTGGQIVSYINAMRAAAGIPAGIVENPAWSTGCANHNHYEAVNHLFGHGEVSGAPAYTPDGDFASRNAVLYQGSTWTATGDPFEFAPGHLSQLLDPRLDAVGAAESEGFGCATTLASLNRPAPAQFVTYTYPPNGAHGWYYTETVHELPFAPQEKVGIPQGVATGPTLYVLFDGPGMIPHLEPGAKITSASLTGPHGAAVPLAVADNQTPGLQGYLPTGGQLIPRSPLAKGTTYTASVTGVAPTFDPLVGQGTHTFSATWSFTTSASVAQLRRAIRPHLGRHVRHRRVTLSVPRAAVGHAAVLTFARDGSRRPRQKVISRLRRTNRLRIPFRRFHALLVQVTVQPFTATDGTHYPSASTRRTYRQRV